MTFKAKPPSPDQQCQSPKSTHLRQQTETILAGTNDSNLPTAVNSSFLVSPKYAPVAWALARAHKIASEPHPSQEQTTLQCPAFNRCTAPKRKILQIAFAQKPISVTFGFAFNAMRQTWGGSSVGRALRSQCRGRGFNSLPLHSKSLVHKLCGQGFFAWFPWNVSSSSPGPQSGIHSSRITGLATTCRNSLGDVAKSRDRPLRWLRWQNLPK